MKPIHYFRDQDVDAAFITPDGDPGASHTGRVSHTLQPGDVNKVVSIVGAVTPNGQGRVSSLSGSLTLTNGELVVGHFEIEPLLGLPFPTVGDSGAILSLADGSPVGVLRAAASDHSYAIATHIDDVIDSAFFRF